MTGRGRGGALSDPPSLVPYGLMVVTIAIAALAVLLVLFVNDGRRGDDGSAGGVTPSPSVLHLTE